MLVAFLWLLLARGQDMTGCPVGPETVPLPGDILNGYASTLQQTINKYNDVPTASVGIVYDQDLIFHYGTNFGNPAYPVPNPDTIYNIGSVTKVFTALLVYAQRDAGKLHLDDEVHELAGLPKWTPSARGMTWRQLITHRAGLQRETPCAAAAGICAKTSEEIIALTKMVPPVAPLNARPSYSNLGFAFAGNLAAQRSNMSFVDLCQEVIFDKLGMTRTGFPKQGVPIPSDFMPGFEDGEPVNPWLDFGYDAPAGGVYSTISDMQKLVSLSFRRNTPLGSRPDQIIDAPTVREWVDPQWVGAGPAPLSGIGAPWELKWLPDSDYWMLAKRGSIYGYTAAIIMVPQYKLAVITFVNTGIYLSITNMGVEILSVIVPVIKKQLEASAPPPIAPPNFDLVGYYKGKPETFPYPKSFLFGNVTIWKAQDERNYTRLAVKAEIVTLKGSVPIANGYLAYSAQYSTPAKEYWRVVPHEMACSATAGGPSQWMGRNLNDNSLEFDAELYGTVYRRVR